MAIERRVNPRGPTTTEGGTVSSSVQSSVTAPRGRSKDPARSDDTRARLIAAALQCFAAKGFHGTTTRDIATAAGMSSAALYVHHKSKEDLLYLVSRQGHEITLNVVREAIASAESPPAQLTAIVRGFTAHHARRHTSARIVNYELAALSAAHRADIVLIRRDIERHLRGVVESGVASGDFDTPDPAMTTRALLSLGIDLARWYDDSGRWTPEAIADHYSELAMRMVRSTKRPPARRTSRSATGL
jgi:AcrR family transcriptional regulator